MKIGWLGMLGGLTLTALTIACLQVLDVLSLCFVEYSTFCSSNYRPIDRGGYASALTGLGS